MEIVPWKSIDSAWFKEALTAFLAAGVERGGDLLPTPRNVSVMLDIGLKGAAGGDPALVAVIGGTPVGFVLWTAVPDVLDSRWRTLIAHGSYTAPAYRHKGVANALRREALFLARAKGYERVIGNVHTVNVRGIQEFKESFGASVTAVQMEVML